MGWKECMHVFPFSSFFFFLEGKLVNVLGDGNKKWNMFPGNERKALIMGLPEPEANLLEISDRDESANYEISHQWRSPDLPSPAAVT